jgi:hypothetical protein
MSFEEEVVCALKVHPKDLPSKLKEELGKLKPKDLTDVGNSLKNVFEVLNSTRFLTGTDSYCQEFIISFLLTFRV